MGNNGNVQSLIDKQLEEAGEAIEAIKLCAIHYLIETHPGDIRECDTCATEWSALTGEEKR